MVTKLSWTQGVLALVCLSIAPVCGTVQTNNDKELPKVWLEAQAEQAKELMGSRLPASRDEVEVSSTEMARYVFEVVEGSLKGRWKSHAHRVAHAVITEANHYRMDPLFLLAVIERESRFNPETRGQFGELGLMQIKPSTAAWLQDKVNLEAGSLLDPVSNIRAGAAYLALLRKSFGNRGQLYVSAYNMGPKNVRDLVKQNIDPTEYMNQVMKHYRRHRHQIQLFSSQNEKQIWAMQ